MTHITIIPARTTAFAYQTFTRAPLLPLASFGRQREQLAVLVDDDPHLRFRIAEPRHRFVGGDQQVLVCRLPFAFTGLSGRDRRDDLDVPVDSHLRAQRRSGVESVTSHWSFRARAARDENHECERSE